MLRVKFGHPSGRAPVVVTLPDGSDEVEIWPDLHAQMDEEQKRQDHGDPAAGGTGNRLNEFNEFLAGVDDEHGPDQRQHDAGGNGGRGIKAQAALGGCD